MTLPDLSPAGCDAGKARLCPEFTQQKTLLIAGQGWYSVRAVGALDLVPTALRITPNGTFGAIRYEFSW